MAVVYILRHGSDDLFKIGSTDNLEQRLRQHHTSNPLLTVFRVIETDSKAAATACDAYLRGRLQSKRHPSAGSNKEFYALTEVEAEDAIRDAQQYLAEDFPIQSKVANLANEESDGRVLVPDDAHWATYRRLLGVREEAHRAKFARALLENQLKLAIGTASELHGVATWKTRRKPKFDEAAFKLAAPDLHGQFMGEVTDRPFVTL